MVTVGIIVLSVVVIILMLIGVIGSIIPNLPGTPVIFIAALIFGLWTGFEQVSIRTVFILGILSLIVTLATYVASAIGAKLGGASLWGVIGAIGGGIVGFIIGSLPGFLIGPFLGSVLFEIIAGKDLKGSLKSGAGSLLGFLGGAVIQLAVAVSMIIIFIVDVLF